ncbi:hypothetical protein F4824DRAFT_495737 [Ustulina deusta]|nr:hypothetical protein F4823DRAFT_557430 [Ustulina deusta]KAI3341879.1 hypothetical protein F4824DRAFT_495737 [Ustulina deusta]
MSSSSERAPKPRVVAQLTNGTIRLSRPLISSLRKPLRKTRLALFLVQSVGTALLLVPSSSSTWPGILSAALCPGTFSLPPLRHALSAVLCYASLVQLTRGSLCIG